MQKIKRILTTAVLTTVMSSGFILAVAPSYASAQTSADAKSAVCKGLGAAFGSNEDCTDPNGAQNIDSTVENAIDLISVVVGVVSVIMIIVGGIKFVTSQGESAGVSSAKNTIVYALVGLIIVALAQTIVKFIISRLQN